MAHTLETLIEKEYETVQKEREDLLAKQAEIADQLRALDRRLEAAANYKATLEGKFARPTPGQRKPRAPSTGRASRGAGGELQKRILAVVARYLPDGAKAEAINAELEATDADGKKKIAAALFRMNKGGVLKQAGARQPYTLGPSAPRATTPAEEEPAEAEVA